MVTKKIKLNKTLKKQDEELEKIVDKAIKDVTYEEKQEETPVTNYELKDYLHLIDINILKHRKEDFEANKKFCAELRAIHLMLNKRQLLLFILIFLCGLCVGGTLVYFFDSIAPFLGYVMDGAKTATNLVR